VIAFSIWNAIWLVFITFLFVSVLMMLFSIVTDMFRDPELSGVAKAMWMIALILFPLIGMFIYVLVRGKGMAERAGQRRQEAEAASEAYIRRVSGSAGGAASELEKASALHAAGTLTDAEFAALKAEILS
jgi:hypothetical protein